MAAAEGALAALRAALAGGDAAQCDAGALERLSEEATLATEVRPARDGAARCVYGVGDAACPISTR